MDFDPLPVNLVSCLISVWIERSPQGYREAMKLSLKWRVFHAASCRNDCSDTHTHASFALFLLLLEEKWFLLTELTLKVFFQREAAHSLRLTLTFNELTNFLLTYWWLAGENNDCIVYLTLFWSFMLVRQHSPQIYWLGSTLRLPLTLEGVIRFRFRSENLMIFYQTARSMWAEMIYIYTHWMWLQWLHLQGAQVRIHTVVVKRFDKVSPVARPSRTQDSWGSCIDLNRCKSPSTAQEI